MDDLFNPHIEAIYDAVTDENGWQPLVERLTQDLDFRSGVFSLERYDLSGVKARTSIGYSEAEEKAIFSYYHQHDIWTRVLFNSPRGRFYSSDVMVPMAKLKKYEFYDFCQKFDVAYSTGATLISEGSLRLKLGFQHTHSQGPTDSKLPYLNRLLPHLTRAVEIRRRIESQVKPGGLLSAIVDGMTDAIFLLNERGSVLYLNAAGDQLLSRTNLVRLISRKLKVDQKAQSLLDTEVVECALMAQGGKATGHQSNILLHDHIGQPNLLIKVDPFSGSEPIFGMPHRQALCLVTVTDVSLALRADASLIKRAYGFTDRELALAMELTRGNTLRQIAAKFHRSPNTLRSQLKSIFLKTGTRSQPQLVSRLLSEPFCSV